jgi:nitrate reductase NapA
MPSAYVELHPDDAAEKSINNGDLVRVVSRRGQIELQAWINGRGRPPRGTVFVPFFDETLLINDLTIDAIDPFSKQPDYKKCAVRISKVGR